ncbi:uncharacterized protein IWZ02DRAFT_115890 [Phyllosticta citriasiana]|uniref:Uncharacterized protein n=1 Tax=Phyllosticta citriasiana TaxID=595635 RepID=A0ABR1KEJ8_9PEZI
MRDDSDNSLFPLFVRATFRTRRNSRIDPIPLWMAKPVETSPRASHAWSTSRLGRLDRRMRRAGAGWVPRGQTPQLEAPPVQTSGRLVDACVYWPGFDGREDGAADREQCCLAVLARGQRARVPQQPALEMLQILHDDCRPHFCVSGETFRLVWLVRVSVQHRTHRKRHVASESLQPALFLMHIMYLVGCRNQSCMNPPLPKKDCFLGSMLPRRRAEPRDIRSRERQL